MDILIETKVKGYVKMSELYLEKEYLNEIEKDKLEDLFYHLLEIEEKHLSENIDILRSKTLEAIAVKRRLV